MPRRDRGAAGGALVMRKRGQITATAFLVAALAGCDQSEDERAVDVDVSTQIAAELSCAWPEDCQTDACGPESSLAANGSGGHHAHSLAFYPVPASSRTGGSLYTTRPAPGATPAFATMAARSGVSIARGGFGATGRAFGGAAAS